MRNRLIVLFVMTVAAGGCSTHAPPAQNDVVIWISLDGMRGDYVDRDRDHLPTLSKLMRDGAFTRELVPVFPSITFPSHVSQITGVPVSEHGVTGNTFYDSSTKQKCKYPDSAALIQAEPIWITATRQGVRAAVIDWPMSYQQTGAVRADYFGDRFEKDQTDADRLAKLLQVWRSDDPSQHGGEPLRLLIGYVLTPDKAGHKFGPDSPELHEQLIEMDRMLGDFLAEAQRLFARDHSNPRDQLWIVLTTDHGMSPSKGVLKLDDVLGKGTEHNLHAALTGPVANLFLDDVAMPGRAKVANDIVQRLRGDRRIRAWTRDNLPKRWHYAYPTRTGDVVAMLDVGWSWKSSEAATKATQAATTQSATTQSATTSSAEPKGQHGYAVEDDPNMLGFAVFAIAGKSLNETNLGRVDSLQLYPTVAKLLGILPTRAATGAAIEFRIGD
ncbi:ectonucleotide pyrophosphatase/phosphodiesterase [soil metagenome]